MSKYPILIPAGKILPEGTLNTSGLVYQCKIINVRDAAPSPSWPQQLRQVTHTKSDIIESLPPENVNDPSFGVVLAVNGTQGFAGVDEIALKAGYYSYDYIDPGTENPQDSTKYTDRATNQLFAVTQSPLTGRKVIVATAGKVKYKDPTDSGWTNATPPTDADLFDVKCVDGDFYACGDFGTLIRSTNGGVGWSVIETGTIAPLLGMTYSKLKRFLYIVGANETGIIARIRLQI